MFELKALLEVEPDVQPPVAEPEDLRDAQIHVVDALAVHLPWKQDIYRLRRQSLAQRPARLGEELRGSQGDEQFFSWLRLARCNRAANRGRKARE